MESITTVRSVEHYLRRLGGALNPDEGLQFGDPNQSVTAVQVCWMATVDAIENAARSGANVIISHEALFYPYPGIGGGGPPDDWMTWDTNRHRLELLCRHRIAVIRFHGTMDRLCIHDEFVKVLGLGAPVFDEGQFARVFTVPRQPVRQLVERVKAAVAMEHLRITPCDLDKEISRVALPWGGTALFVNVAYQQKLIELKPDVFIAGESDCYGFIFASDAGIIVIETSHEVSENFGIKVFAERMQAEVNVPVTYYANPRAWIVV
jgi:putative NIF3 family GTP cyclohydrolase 1 type 2